MRCCWLLIVLLVLAGSSSVQAAGLVGLGDLLGGSFSGPPFDICIASAAPEPTTGLLLGLGLLGLGIRRRRAPPSDGRVA